jgi:8-oxo-dGTP pyrophosphatase MutT (NUDIX family)
MSNGKLHLIPLSRMQPTKSSPPGETLASRRQEQVAAICYRLRSTTIDFLLVRTRKGRWTFPKGGIKPGTTRAESAALEAFEEAGVHGRIEEASFLRYSLQKADSQNAEVPTHAFLCETLWLEPPQESNRNPEWFSPESAKRRLRQERKPQNGAELSQVIDRAVTRIQRLRERNGGGLDAMQKVTFEASEVSRLSSRMEHVAFVRYMRRQREDVDRSSVLEFAVKGNRGKLKRLGPAEP